MNDRRVMSELDSQTGQTNAARDTADSQRVIVIVTGNR